MLIAVNGKYYTVPLQAVYTMTINQEQHTINNTQVRTVQEQAMEMVYHSYETIKTFVLIQASSPTSTKPSSPATGLTVVGTSQSGGWMSSLQVVVMI